MKARSVSGFLRPCLVAVLGLARHIFAEGDPGSPPPAVSLSFDRVGAVADNQFSGQGLAVISSPEGAHLRCLFRRLNGRVTARGLWLASTFNGAKGDPFRIIARAFNSIPEP